MKGRVPPLLNASCCRAAGSGTLPDTGVYLACCDEVDVDALFMFMFVDDDDDVVVVVLLLFVRGEEKKFRACGVAFSFEETAGCCC